VHRPLDAELIAMAQITVLRPDEPAAEAESLPLATRSVLPDRPVIGLVANGKPLAREILRALAEEIAEHTGREVELEVLEKPSAAYQITAEQAKVMAVRAHIVISGLGD
jgi:hypothetical protein